MNRKNRTAQLQGFCDLTPKPAALDTVVKPQELEGYCQTKIISLPRWTAN